LFQSPWLWAYWPRRMEVREGQHRGGGCIGAVEGGAADNQLGLDVRHLGDRSRVLVVGEHQEYVRPALGLGGGFLWRILRSQDQAQEDDRQQYPQSL